MPRLAFATDLHGRPGRYSALFAHLAASPPDLLLLGGDLLPHGFYPTADTAGFLTETFHDGFARLRDRLGERYPQVYLIPGNDDPAASFQRVDELGEESGLWTNVHGRVVECMGLALIGYSFVPPTPFQLKDWEKYDVSRYVDPGSVSPENGRRSVEVDANAIRYETIAADLNALGESVAMDHAVLLAHSPPYETHLDRAALDGKMIDHVPLDPHVGSIAMRRWIEQRQPLLTLHGHVHESTERTGHWRQQLGRTWMINGATGKQELVVVEVSTVAPEDAARHVIRLG